MGKNIRFLSVGGGNVIKKQEDKKVKKAVDKLREEVVQKFFGLSEKLYKHIETSIQATKPCTSCSIVNGEHKPTKIGVDGKCAFCHGTYLVPDIQQRNWATEQAQPIIAPAPKVVDMAVEQTSNVPELEEKVKAMDSKTIDEALKSLGISFGTDKQ